jgi:hypothetical protein
VVHRDLHRSFPLLHCAHDRPRRRAGRARHARTGRCKARSLLSIITRLCLCYQTPTHSSIPFLLLSIPYQGKDRSKLGTSRLSRSNSEASNFSQAEGTSEDDEAAQKRAEERRAQRRKERAGRKAKLAPAPPNIEMLLVKQQFLRIQKFYSPTGRVPRFPSQQKIYSRTKESPSDPPAQQRPSGSKVSTNSKATSDSGIESGDESDANDGYVVEMTEADTDAAKTLEQSLGVMPPWTLWALAMRQTFIQQLNCASSLFEEFSFVAIMMFVATMWWFLGIYFSPLNSFCQLRNKNGEFITILCGDLSELPKIED